MARNKLSDLNDHLFAQMERLSEEDMKPEDLKNEIGRAKAMESIGKQILSTAKITMDAAKLKMKFQEAGYEFTNDKLID